MLREKRGVERELALLGAARRAPSTTPRCCSSSPPRRATRRRAREAARAARRRPSASSTTPSCAAPARRRARRRERHRLDQRRRRRHRRRRLGRDAAAHVPALGERTATRPRSSTARPARRPASAASTFTRRRATTPTATCKAEEGVHRLVRISPFDSQHRRHTAFASVSVFPEIDDAIEVEIDEKDLRVDTYRAGGAGGQHVNKTDSAVRLTHLPTGIVVQCQNERSQHKNRSQAMKVLRARLYERARREQEEKLAALRGEQTEIGFGSQIRSYTLHPPQRVKDHRTDVEIGNVDGVLDGDLDRFIRATLLQRAAAPARGGGVSEQRARSARARAARGAARARASTRIPRASGRARRVAELRARCTTRRTPRQLAARAAAAVAVAGRVRALRSFGKLLFLDADRGRRGAPGERAQGGACPPSVFAFADASSTSATSCASRARSGARRRASSRVDARELAAAREGAAPAAREVARAQRRRGALPPALPRPARRTSARARSRCCAAARVSALRALPRRARLPRGRDAGAPAALRRRRGAALHDAPQRLRPGRSTCASRTSCT